MNIEKYEVCPRCGEEWTNQRAYDMQACNCLPTQATWVDLQKLAETIVREKFVFKRFIEGTPLENDIACWMADFAEGHAALVRAGALVKAADICDRVNNYDNPMTAGDCADAIRALKEQA